MVQSTFDRSTRMEVVPALAAGLAGMAAYPILVAPVLLWFSRTVAPFPKVNR